MKTRTQFKLEKAVSPKSGVRPLLEQPWLEVVDGRGWLLATDSFLGVEVEVEDVGDDDAGFVSLEALKAGVQPDRSTVVRCQDGKLAVDGVGEFVRPDMGQPPPVREMIGKAHAAEHVFEVRFDAGFLYRLAQALGGTEVILRFESPVKPIAVSTAASPEARGILMPRKPAG